ncbi:MAG: O-antigen ligase family protein [Thiobacillus sp.]
MSNFYLPKYLMPRVGENKASIAAFFLLFILAVSLPPKWASLHFAGLAFVLAVGLARREDWQSPALRTYLLVTSLWLVPVVLTGGMQYALGVATAPDWPTLPVLVLRMLGIGLGLIVLLQRGYLTMQSAIFALLLALTIHATAGLVDLFTTPNASLTGWREMRITGLVFNPNPFGLFMALAAILCAGFLRDNPRWLAGWTLLIAFLLCVWASGSRGAFLTVATGLVVLFPPSNRMRLLIYLFAIALAAVAYLYLDSAVRNATMQSDNARMQIIAFSLEQIQRSPWIGWGIGAYESLPGRVVNAPHNMWLDLAISSGLVALAGAITATALLAYRLYRCSGTAAQLALAMFGASLVAGTLEYSIVDSTHFRGVWVLVTALGCYLLNACGSEPRSSSSSPRAYN